MSWECLSCDLALKALPSRTDTGDNTSVSTATPVGTPSVSGTISVTSTGVTTGTQNTLGGSSSHSASSGPSTSSGSSTPLPEATRKTSITGAIAGAVGGFVGGVCFVALVFFLCRRRKQRNGESTEAPQLIDPFTSSGGTAPDTNAASILLAESSTQSGRRSLDHQQSSGSKIRDFSDHRGMDQPNLGAGFYTIGGSRKAGRGRVDDARIVPPTVGMASGSSQSGVVRSALFPRNSEAPPAYQVSG